MAGDIPISQLPAVPSSLLTDFGAFIQNGITSKTTLQNVMTLFQSSMNNLTGLTGSLQAPTFIGDSLGNKSLLFNYTPNAVNYVYITNSATTIAPIIGVSGTDTNIGLWFLTGGNAPFTFNVPGGAASLNLVPNYGSQSNIASITISTITANRTYTLPDATGTFALNSQLFSWTDITVTSVNGIVNNGYIADNASLVTLTLPTTAAQGTIIELAGNGAGGWKIAQNAGQQINFGAFSTTVGVTGSLSSTQRYNSVRLLCVVSNLTFNVLSSQGNLKVV